MKINQTYPTPLLVRLSSFTYYGFILVFILIMPSISSNAIAWFTYGHMQMTEEAINIMPSASFPPVENPGTYRFSLLLGSGEPDQNRVIDHTNVPQCAWMINKLAKKCEKMIRNGKDWDEILFTMGQATHYIQDLNCPHHGIGEYREGDHEDFEGRATRGDCKPEKFDGFHYISNYKIFAYNAARFSARYIYFADRLGSIDKDYQIYYEELITPLWEHSVNDVVDLWLTILNNGLGDKKYRELGFPKQIGVRAQEKTKFPKMKKVAHIGAATCFIATAAYGSPIKQHVKVLRNFRDRFLLSNNMGKTFVDIYYCYSPPIADFIENHNSLRPFVRISLLPLVGMSWVFLKFGLIPTLAFIFLLIGTYLICLTGLRRRFRKK